MARNFPDPISLTIPLRTTWEEVWLVQDDDGAAIDLTGYELRMQVRDRLTGELVLEIDTTAPDPFATIEPAEGEITIKVPADVVAAASPDNFKRATRWDCEIYIPAGADPEYVVPLLRGSATFTARQTVIL